MTSTISVPAGKLRLMLTAVLPHANDDDTLPALCGVNFEMCGGTLFLAATDRYTLGVAREQVPGAIAAGVPDQSALLPLEAARDLRRMLKKQAGDIAILIEDGNLKVEAGSVSGSWATVAKAKFPKWRTLIRPGLTGTTVPLGDGYGVNAERLTRLAAGARKTGEALRIRVLLPAKKDQDRGRPPMVAATVGDWFLGVVMPVRMDGAPAQWDDWTSVTAPAGKADDAAETAPEKPDAAS